MLGGGGVQVEACEVSQSPWRAGADRGTLLPTLCPRGHKAWGSEDGCRPGPEWPSLVPETHGQGVGWEWAGGASTLAQHSSAWGGLEQPL